MNTDRPIRDFFTALLCDELFIRFPNLRMASIENGAGYLRDLLTKLAKTHRQFGGYFTEDPVEVFREHVWINPFWEDEVDQVVELMSAERVLFGSDWPHAEGLVLPLDYLADVAHLDETARNQIIRGNVVELTELRPV